MKAHFVRRRGSWILGATLLGGLLYSAMTVGTKIAYASSCDCNEANQDAAEFCSTRGGLASFSCPYVSGTTVYFKFECNSTNEEFDFPCAI
jgi:hypothetical protein